MEEGWQLVVAANSSLATEGSPAWHHRRAPIPSLNQPKPLRGTRGCEEMARESAVLRSGQDDSPQLQRSTSTKAPWARWVSETAVPVEVAAMKRDYLKAYVERLVSSFSHKRIDSQHSVTERLVPSLEQARQIVSCHFHRDRSSEDYRHGSKVARPLASFPVLCH